MGDFISRGIAIGFAAGVTAALIARRHALTKKHPNLIGFAVAGTADAITRDYRRPMVYDRLLKLDTPLATKAKSFLFAMRTGSEESSEEVSFMGAPWANQVAQKSVSTESVPVNANSERDPNEVGWWEDRQMEDASVPRQNDIHGGYETLHLPKGGPFNGTRTWDDIRKQKNGNAPL